MGPLEPGDLLLFFGQAEFVDDGQTRSLHFHFDTEIDFQTLWVFLKWFPSKGQAMKAGWKGPIPKGYSEFRKKYVDFYILNLGNP